MWTALKHELTTVALQQDYDISAAGFYNNTPHSVNVVTDQDTEIDAPLYDWEIREGTDLHLGSRITDARTLRLFGIKLPTLVSISQPQLLILTARAAIDLYIQAIAAGPNDQVGRYSGLLRTAEIRFQERVIRHMKMAMPKTIRTEAYEQSLVDTIWRIT